MHIELHHNLTKVKGEVDHCLVKSKIQHHLMQNMGSNAENKVKDLETKLDVILQTVITKHQTAESDWDRL